MQDTPNDLAKRSCKSAGAKPPRLEEREVNSFIAKLPGWEVKDGAISKTFPFKNYYETLAFVNATAWISHREDHHPDLEVGYNKVRMRYSTHSAGGLSEFDFICAAKVEALLTI